MKAAATSQRDRHPVFSNVVAGLTSGLVTLVYAVSFAALIFSERLAPHFPQGLGILLVGAAATAIVVAWRSPFPFTLAGPEANSAIVVALAAKSIANAIPPEREATLYPTVWAGIALGTLICGVFLYLLGRCRLGQLARYIPYPVMGGFLAGTGWLITRSSFKVMTGFPLGFAELPRLLQPELADQWLAGIAVASVLYYLLNRSKHFSVLPGVLLGGTLLGNLVVWIAKQFHRGTGAQGWFLEPFSRKGVWDAWTLSTLHQIDWSVLMAQSGTLVPLLVIVVLSILLNATGLELASSRSVDLNDELRADGLANVVSGALGGMVGHLSINRCLLNSRAGATFPLAGFVAGGLCAGVLVFGSSFLAVFPKPLLGGLLLYQGVNLLLRWALHSRSHLPRLDYMLVVLILIIIANAGLLAGIAAGLFIACILFIVSYGKTSSIKSKLSGASYRSNLLRSSAEEEILRAEGDSTSIFVLHGFVFFGTAHALLDSINARLTETARRPLRVAIFDFRLVTGLDSSALLSFQKLAQVAARSELRVVITHASTEIQNQFSRSGFPRAGGFRYFPDLDHGMEWCENELLDARGSRAVTSVSMAAQLAQLLDENCARELLPHLEAVHLQQGDFLFREGDQSDRLYFVECGRVSVVVGLEDRSRLRRRTYTGGTILGEMGFFSGAPRSASVIADESSRLFALSREAFDNLERTTPLLAARFAQGVVKLLSDRLRRSEEEVRMLMK